MQPCPVPHDLSSFLDQEKHRDGALSSEPGWSAFLDIISVNRPADVRAGGSPALILTTTLVGIMASEAVAVYWLALLGVGLLAGITSGFFGIGGGIVIIPMLRYFFEFDQHHAQGTSLAVLLLPIGIFGVIKYYQAGYVYLNQGLVIALGFLLGAFLGAMGAIPRADATLSRAFGVLLIVVGIYQFFKP